MIEKVGKILSSVRFWIVTLAAASVYVGVVQQNGFDLKALLDALGIWLGTVAGIGTLDSVAQNISGTKQ